MSDAAPSAPMDTSGSPSLSTPPPLPVADAATPPHAETTPAPAVAADAPMESEDDAAAKADDARLELEIQENERREAAEAEERAKKELKEKEEREAKEKKEAEERKTWTETLYINNLNEKVKIPILKKCLEILFGSYGPVLSITAHENVRMRGQAFVAFESKDTAAKAKKEVDKFPLYGKPMQIQFAKTKSDAVVEKQDKEAFASHKETRKEHKAKVRHDNPLAQKNKLKRKLASGEVDASTLAAPGAKRVAVMMPEEYLPPNATLFVQNLMDGIGKEELEELFGTYAGLVTVRTIAARKDIAFVDYVDETSSKAAKEGLNNHKLGPGEGEPMRVTFARK